MLTTDSRKSPLGYTDRRPFLVAILVRGVFSAEPDGLSMVTGVIEPIGDRGPVIAVGKVAFVGDLSVVGEVGDV